jgi:Cytochrome C'
MTVACVASDLLAAYRMRFRTAILLLALSAAFTPSRPVSADPPRTPKLEPSGSLPKMARTLLHERMQRHGADVNRLLTAVILLRYDETAEVAETIASEPRLSRPVPNGENDLNALLPENFFRLQDQLRDRARAVARAAEKHDDAKLAPAFGKLTETCVSCHSVYRNTPESK